MTPGPVPVPEQQSVPARPSVLELRDFSVSLPSPSSTQIVSGVDLTVSRGERVALVGESGSGKTTIARSALRLDRRMLLTGSLTLDGTQVVGASERTLRGLRGSSAAIVFQDPMTALNPVLPVGIQVAEPLRIRGVGRREANRRAIEMLSRLGIPDAPRRFRAYPGEFSGGMRQRVVMAAALIASPSLLIADEPTTALDVRVQEQMLDLIVGLSDELGLAVLLITHDLALVAGFAHRVAVLRNGGVVEEGETDQVFDRPRHPYTRGLLAAIPRLTGDRRDRLETVEVAMAQGEER